MNLRVALAIRLLEPEPDEVVDMTQAVQAQPGTRVVTDLGARLRGAS